MIARKLTPQEIWRSRLNMAVAFEGSFDLEKERETSKTEKADPQADHWGAFLEGEDAPGASFVMNLFDVRFDGHKVKMGGVGGVATLPAYRRGGAIRECMKAAFRDLYDRGFAFSALYPFSSAFYRKFGFENSVLVHGWTLPLRDLKFPDVGGKVRQLFPGDSLAPLLGVYDQVYDGCNLAVLRQEYDKSLTEKNLLDQQRYIFVWEDETGRPGAFLIGGRKGETLNCRTDFSARNGLLFRDARALMGLLSFVRTAFLSNFEEIYFCTPAWQNVLPLFPETATMKEEAFVNGMVRVVNTELVLKLCRCRGEGTVAIEVTDPLLPENNQVFRLSFAPGQENRVERIVGAADITLGVGELGLLLCGVYGAEDLPWLPGVVLHDPDALLGSVFYHKKCHILDLF